MTQRICIIGDSHTAALKKGWPQVCASFPGVDLTFFAAARNALSDLEPSEEALLATSGELRKQLELTSGGYDKIPGSFDLYVLCGLKFSNWPMMLIYRTMEAEDVKDTTNATFVGNLESHLSGTLAIRTLAKLRKCTNAETLVIATPFKPVDQTQLYWERLKRTGDGPRLEAVFNLAATNVTEQFRATFIPQPDDTIASNRVNTRPKFLRQAVSGGVGDDATHMGTDFGAIVLRNALNKWLDKNRHSLASAM